MPMSRQVSAQRIQEAAWALNGTRIGYRTEWGGIGGNGPVRGGLKQAKGPRRYSRGLVAARSVA